MSVLDLAQMAGAYDRNAIAVAARDWLAGPGSAFLRLKRNEVSALRRVIDKATTPQGMKEALEKHLEALAKRRKGTSPWEKTGSNGVTMLQSLFSAMEEGVDVALAGEPIQRTAWERVQYRLARELDVDSQKDFENHRRTQACFEFIDDLIRRHQSRKIEKELTTLWQPPQVS